MSDTLVLWLLAICLAVSLVGWCILFSIFWQALARVFAMLAIWNTGRKFFKQIERFRRDFK